MLEVTQLLGVVFLIAYFEYPTAGLRDARSPPPSTFEAEWKGGEVWVRRRSRHSMSHDQPSYAWFLRCRPATEASSSGPWWNMNATIEQRQTPPSKAFIKRAGGSENLHCVSIAEDSA